MSFNVRLQGAGQGFNISSGAVRVTPSGFLISSETEPTLRDNGGNLQVGDVWYKPSLDEFHYYLDTGWSGALLTQDLNVVPVSTFPNDAGYITTAEVPAVPVTSVNGETGDVTLDATDVGALKSGDNISALVNDAGYVTAAGGTIAQSQVTDLVDDLNAKADLVNGTIPTSQLPAVAITEFLGAVATEAAMISFRGQPGDWCLRTDVSVGFVIVAGDGSDPSHWQAFTIPGSAVTSLQGQVGDVVLAPSDIGAATNVQGSKADTALQPADINVNVQPYDVNTVIDALYVRTERSFTNAEHTKLANIEAGAEVNVQADWNATSGDALILNKPTFGSAATSDTSDFATAAQGALADTSLQSSDVGVTVQGYDADIVIDANYVATDENFTTADHAKLDGIQPGAEVNVQADWNAIAGDAVIINKPALGSAATANTTDFATSAQGALADTALQPADIGVSVQSFDADTVVDALYVRTDENFTTADSNKLDGIESGATADQTPLEIKTAYESNADTNAFTDAEQTKLSGIEAGATGDQTAAEIKTAYESNADTNAFDDAAVTKLASIEAGATGDQTNAEIKAAYESNLNTNAFTDLEQIKLAQIQAGAEVNVDTNLSYTQSTNELASSTGTNVTLPLVGTTANTDGLMSHEDKVRLDGIEDNATADQTGAEIKSLYEAEADTNAFTDADVTKLSGIEAGATADQTDAEIKAAYENNLDTNVFDDAAVAKLAGIESNATADQTGAEIKSLYEAEADTNAFTDADVTKLSGIAAGAEVNVDTNLSYDAATRELASSTGTDVTLPLAVAGGNAGLLEGSDKTQLDSLATDLAGKADLSGGKLLTSQLPDLAITEYLGQVANETAMLALTGEQGDWAIRTDDGKVYVITGSNPSLASNWTALNYPVASGTNISYDSATRTVASSNGNDATLPLVVAGGDAGLLSGADKTKLDGIESGATADQTGAEIKSLYEAEADTNAFDDAAVSKLAGIEAGATADQTAAEIKSLYESNLDTNVFDDAAETKLAGIQAGAEVNVDTNLSYTQSTNQLASSTGTNVTLPTAGSSFNQDGLMSWEDKSKLNAIESGATADQTGAEIKSLYESQTNTNAFTDSEKSKLSGIASGAEVNVQADWTAVSGDAFIQNKPTLGTAAATDSTAYATAAQGTTADSAIQPTDSIDELADVDTTSVAPQGGQVLMWDGTNSVWNPGTVAVGSGTTNLDFAASPTGAIVYSDTGDNANVTLADGTDAGLMSPGDFTKLSNIETAATADQTGAEIKSLYEAESDTNAFTDADHSKLDGIEAGAQVNVATNLSYTQSSNVLSSSTGTNVTIPLAAPFTNQDGLMSWEDKSKLNGIESGATADQTGAEIKSLYEAQSNTNAFTDADETKLDGIEAGAQVNVAANLTYTQSTNELSSSSGNTVTLPLAGDSTDEDGLMSHEDKAKLDGIEVAATADQTGAEIKALYEAEADTNAFTDADHTKLDGIEAGATADQTAAEIKTAYESNLDTNAFTDADETKLDGIEAGAEVNVDTNLSYTQSTNELASSTGTNVTLPLAGDSLDEDGLMSHEDKAKLDGIEAGATADQTASEIKSLYESNADTNAFTDADESKLDGIEAGATADQTAAEIKTAYESNLDTNAFTDADHTKLDGIEAGAQVNVAANLSYTQSTNELSSSTGTNVTLPLAGDSVDEDGLMSHEDKAKLDGIETGATADQTGAEIKSLYEAEADTNAFTDADHTKLDGIEAGAQVNLPANLSYTQSTNELASSTGTNVTLPLVGDSADEDGLMSHEDKAKLDGIEAGATADQTGAEIKALYEAQTNTNAFTDADHTKLDGIETAATADQTGAEIKSLYEAEDDTNAFDDAAVTKLAGIETAATADQTGAEIKSLYEAEADTNAFTDADHSKLDGIEAGATADQTAAEILSLLVTVDGAGSTLDADTLDGLDSLQFVRSDQDDTMTGNLTITNTDPGLIITDTDGGDTFKVRNAGTFFRITNETDTRDDVTIDGDGHTTFSGNISLGGTVDGRDVAADGTKLDGIESGAQVNVAANLSYTSSTRELASSTGTNVTLPLAVAGGDAGLLTGADKTQLDSLSTDLDGKADLSGGKLLTSQLPDLAITEYLGEVANQTAMLALTGEEGDWAIRTDDGKVYVITGSDPSVAANWTALSYPVPADTNLSYTSGTRELASSTGTNVTLPLVVSGGDAGLQTGADKAKLDGIEAGATADQTGAEIKSLYEGEADTNAFDDAAVAKLAGIETAATADQTGSEIKSLYEAELDTNAFTDSLKSKLENIEAGAEVNVDTNLSYTQSTNELASSTGTNVTLPLAGAATDEDGLMSHEDKAKLDGIESGATADQTGAEIKSLYEGEADTNAFTDADHTKLDGIEAGAQVNVAANLSYTQSTNELASSTGTNVTLPLAGDSADEDGLMSHEDKAKLDGIESGATGDQTAAEIKTAYESNADTNAFTDADHTKLDGIETGATADQTGSEIKSLYEAELDTNAFTDADHTKLDGIEAGAEVNVDTNLSYTQSTNELASSTGTNVTLPLAGDSADEDGLMSHEDKAKLDGIEAGATADQTGAEIKSLYEAEADTNAYTDAEKSKLAGIEAGATADQTAAEIKTAYESNLDTNAFTDADHTKLDGIEAGAEVNVDTNLTYTQSTNELASSTGTNVTLPLAGDSVDEDGLMSHEDKAKLDLIEAGATADQSASEIKTAYESNADTNAFDDAAVSKLAGIEAGATADQTAAEIKTAYESNLDTNAFTDADHTKLDGIAAGAEVNVDTNLSYTQSTNELASSTGTNVTLPLAGDQTNEDGLMSHEDKAKLDGIETGATADQTGAEIKSLYESQTNTNAFTDADATKLDGIEAGAQVNVAADLSYTQSTNELASSTGTNVTLPLAGSATDEDGLMSHEDKAKLDGIESGATADQTGAEIKTAYEAEADTNAFTDAEKSKLAAIAAGAEVNVDTNLSYTQSTNELASSTGTNVTLPLAGDQTNEDGLMSHEDKAKLDGIETGATADQTAAEIKTAYESNNDTNVFDDAAVTKLAGIESAATADQTGAEIKSLYEGEADTNAFTDADHTKLDGIEAGAQVNVAADLSYTQSTNELASSTGTNVTLPLAGTTTDTDGLMSHEDKAKLDGIETGAEANVDTNLSYTQSTNELASSTGTNVTLPLAGAATDEDGLMSHEDKAKLDGIESNATADQTGAEIKTAYEAEADTNAFTDAEKSKLSGIASGAEVNVDTNLSYTQSTNELASSTGTNVTLPLAGSAADEDGLMSHEDKAKLDGIETAATADQTGAEIKSLYEAEADTNAFTDADHSKLDGIEANATADQTAAEIKTAYESNLDTNVFDDAAVTKLSGIAAGAEVNVDTNLSYTSGTRELASSTGTNVTLPLAVAGGDAGLLTGADKTQLDNLTTNLDGKADLSGGKLLTSQLPDLAITEYLGQVANETAMLALTGQEGDWAIRTDDSKVYVITGSDPSDAADWTALSYPVAADTNLTYTSSTRVLASSTGTDATIPLVVAAGDAGLMTGADKTKLDGIETGATADQTGAEIKSLYEAEADTNAFTDADHTKLDGIEANATADQTGAEIKSLYEAEDDTNAFTDADHTKLDGIEAGAEVNVDTNLTYTQSTNELASSTGTNVTLPLAGAATDEDGLMSHEDKAKLDGIEAGATADQTDAEIKTAYENNSDTNAFTDAEQTKLSGIEAGAQVNVAANLSYTQSTNELASSTGTNVTLPLAGTTTDTDGLMSHEDKAKLDGIATGAEANVDTNLSYTQSTNELASSTGTNVTLPLAGAATDEDGLMSHEDKSKLDGIAAGAQVNVATDLTYTQSTNELASSTGTNVTLPLAGTAANTDGLMSHEDKSKLDGIETGATADQTGAEIKSLYEAENDTNAFTDAEKTKLSNIEASATADQTGAEIKSLYEAEADTNAFDDAAVTKLAGIAAGAEVNVNADWNAASGDAQILNKPTLGTAAATDSTAYATAAQGTLADSATQPGDNISTLTNDSGFITSADGADAATLDSLDSTQFLRSDESDTMDGALTVNGDVTITDDTADDLAGPEFTLYRNSASPADGDYLGQIRFLGKQDNGGDQLYAKITGKTSDVSLGTEDGLIEYAVVKDGTQTIVSRLTGDALKLINGTGLEVAGNITVTGTVDGRDVATDGTKLDGIEAGAEVNPTNVSAFTNDAGYITSADGGNASTIDSLDSTQFVRSDEADTMAGNLTISNTLPAVVLTDTDGGDSFEVRNSAGTYSVYNVTDTRADLSIAGDGTATFAGNVDFDLGIDVTGNITVTGTVDGRDVATDGTKLDGIEAGATGDQTASEILTAIKTVDGTSSGLDADTVDGLESVQFLRSDSDDLATGVIRFQSGLTIGADNDIQLSESDVGEFTLRTGTTGSYNELTYSAAGVLTLDSNTVWHAGNDGTGSTLDADLLDGQEGSYYLDYNNFTNTPTIPTNNNELTNGAGYITSADGGNAATLDSIDSSQFLRSDATDTATGALTFSGGLEISDGPGTIAGTTFANGWLRIGSSSLGYAFDSNELVTFGACLVNSASGSTMTFNNRPRFNGGTSGTDSPFTVDSTEVVANLNADLLDGQEGSHYLDYNNFTNTPTIPTNNNQLTNGAGYITSADGGDADTLDGVQGSSYMRTDNSQTVNARHIFNHNEVNNYDTIATATGSLGCLEVRNSGSGNDAFMTFHASGDYALYFGLDADTNDLAVGGWSKGAVKYKLWHEGNDGSGSGLDADLLDGQNMVNNASTGNTIPGRNGSGDIFARLIRQTYTDQSTISGGMVFRVNNSTDNYLRVCNDTSAIRTYLGVTATGADTNYLAASGDTATGTMTFNGVVNFRNHVDLADNDILRFGTGDDAEFFFNGTNQYLDLNSGATSFIIRNSTTTRFTFTKTGDLTATGDITAFSDINLKENIEVIPDALDKVSQLRGVTYNRTDTEDNRRQSGVIAQEVEEVLPEVVHTNEEGIKSVAYGNLVGLLIESIKELKAEVEALKAERN